MKESKTQGERQKIFSCCFNDEQTVRSQGGVPTNVTFSNGVATFTNGYIAYDKEVFVGSAFSFHYGGIKITALTALIGLYGRSSDASNPKAYIHTNGKLYVLGYNNAGGAFTYVFSLNTVYDILVTTSNARHFSLYVNGVFIETIDTGALGGPHKFKGLMSVNAGGTYPFNGQVEVAEFYNYTLSAQEVANLYNNSRLRDVNFNKTEQLGPELVVNGGFDTDTDWTKSNADWTIHDGKAYYGDTAAGVYITPNVGITFTAGKRYRLIYTVSGLTAGTAAIRIFNQSINAFLEGHTDYVTRVNGTYTETVVCTTTSTNFRFYGNTASSTPWQLDNLSIKEIVCESTQKILDVCCGVNKLRGESYGNNMIPEASSLFDTDGTAWWSKNAGSSKVWNSAGYMTVTFDNSGYIYKTNNLSSGKSYALTCKYRGTVGNLYAYGGSGAIKQFPTPTLNWQTATVVFTQATADLTTYIQISGATGYVDFDEIILKEVIPSVVNTAVSIVKDGDVNAMSFNGTTSKLDCGSYDGLTGDKTFVAWIKLSPKGYITSTLNPVITNSKVSLYLRYNRVYFFSDGATSANSNNTQLTVGPWYLITVTRTSVGITNFYINSLLSGTANQSSGTPVTGTTNIVVGNTSTNYLNGNLDKVRTINGILTTSEISEIYTAEKAQYGL